LWIVKKNALRIDHLKKLLRNHIKTFAQLGNRIAGSTLCPILHLLTRELRIPNSLPQRTTRPAEAPASGQTPGVVCRGVVA